MPKNRRLLFLMFAIIAVAAATALSAEQSRVTRSTVNGVLADWPQHPREAVQKFVAEYGLPNEITSTTVVWFANGPWKRTVVYRNEIAHDFPKPHTDFVEQFIDYRVPPEKFDELAAYDGSVIVERTKGEISARCDKEPMNFLALNLANDVVKGNKTVEEARRFYADTAMAAMKGAKPPYTTALQFSSGGRTADVDTTIIPQSVLSSMAPEPPEQPGSSSANLDPNRLSVTSSGVDAILATWPSHPRDSARKLIDKYGLPNEATASRLTWFNNGPWKRTIIFRDEVPHNFPKPHTDYVQQFIDYRVPIDKFDEVAAYDGSVISERTKGEISARCDKEEMNMLALNLASDIITGGKTVDQARQAYADNAVAAMQGQKPAYTTALQFARPSVVTADRDMTIIPQAMTSSVSEQSEPAVSATATRHRRMSKD